MAAMPMRVRVMTCPPSCPESTPPDAARDSPRARASPVQLRRGLRPVYLGLRRVGEEVEGHVQLTGQQAPGPELGAKPGLDQRVHACPPFARRRLRAAQLAPRPQALRIERDLNRKVDELGCVIEFHPDGSYLADGDPAEVKRRAHR